MSLNEITIEKGPFSGKIGSTPFSRLLIWSDHGREAGPEPREEMGNKTAMSFEINIISRAAPFATANTDPAPSGLHGQKGKERREGLVRQLSCAPEAACSAALQGGKCRAKARRHNENRTLGSAWAGRFSNKARIFFRISISENIRTTRNSGGGAKASIWRPLLAARLFSAREEKDLNTESAELYRGRREDGRARERVSFGRARPSNRFRRASGRPRKGPQGSLLCGLGEDLCDLSGNFPGAGAAYPGLQTAGTSWYPSSAAFLCRASFSRSWRLFS